ncbi:putative urea carboxylase [Gordonia polyisoprenivorans NBRC 16320 = JCM 10675]|uniref:5-oxoprolinase/urea amidolyase family protein n=1 Tax=Gordonia polyisoprenivorans TaxID=84595 RepID=A0A846WQ38_9ACTN|nr:5-oxoprolinase/urea amidolyase family protein [Gordonia polyisoprenivorans]NKY03347.1 5-oxoprolinase/urea amidolyase family protein [Gordonia polyisoprenivorans]OZC31738.1 urea amidolyase [Gordonia polyisoprenivorans]GAB21835.1 putative urea carboxylase [Gordonia polyisoprenivorans NBRC 16320 = JCM 10675]
MTACEILRAGPFTTVQDWPGRTGYWKVGVPPSGPMDDLSFRLANQAVGNPDSAAGLEATMAGPRLRFDESTVVAVTGAPASISIDGTPAAQWVPLHLQAGQVLDIGTVGAVGLRVYVAVAGGIDVEEYLGSRSTFTMGRFGGKDGRTLADGDTLPIGPAGSGPITRILTDEIPALTNSWELAVTVGPHSAPEFFTAADIDDLMSTGYEVHFNSDRTGIRLIGPQPRWARSDGGEAGLHPSNIHDNAYSVGALDFTGDTPILLGPDGPSLGGFVCPVTVVAAERWKLGQLKPGDTVRFVAVRSTAAASPSTLGRDRRASFPHVLSTGGDADHGILGRTTTADGTTEVTYRRSGDDNILVEYGDMRLDLELRARVHALSERIAAERPRGLIDLTPGIRSLQVKADPDVWSQTSMLQWLSECEAQLPSADDLVVPSRVVDLPLSWDDPATREAIERYMLGVRSDAPWCPWNIEFIRRMNGLDSVDDVHRIVFDAEYLVLGLGDVYLGAPVAVPLDPRHRLVTTKYNPARTWTPENAVGIGGAYLCIYGMEGPGGYQFVGRTTQVWNHRHPQTTPGFDPEHPWLLRFFDRIRWYPVSAEELLDMRADVAAGRGDSVRITDGMFSLSAHQQFLDAHADEIDATRGAMESARAEERERWSQGGEFAA